MILAFTSDAQQAGKNTAADFVKEICEEQDIEFLQLAFGDKMKLLVAEVLGMIITTGDEAQEIPSKEAIVATVDEFKLHGDGEWKIYESSGIESISSRFTGREFIINLAEGARTLFGTDFWTEQLFASLEVDRVVDEGVVVITDLSYDQEARAVRENMGHVVKIINSRVSNSRLRPGLGLSNDSVDAYIKNEGTLEEFRETIRSLMVATRTW